MNNNSSSQPILATTAPFTTVAVATEETNKPNPFFFSTEENEMYVTKRNGKTELVSFDKILKRIKNCSVEKLSGVSPIPSSTASTASSVACSPPQNSPIVGGVTAPTTAEQPGTFEMRKGVNINYASLAMKVIEQMYNKISTTKIDELCAEQCASLASVHPDYNILAGKIIISNHHRDTPSTFSKAMSLLYKYKNKHGKPSPMLSEDVYLFIHKRASQLDALCGDCRRDYLLDYFGFKTLEKSYLMRINGKIVERPQYMWLRVAVGIHATRSSVAVVGDEQMSGEKIMEKITETYNYMSKKYMTHATPTLFNAGTPHPQLSSCFLEAMESDSIEGIYNTVKDCALISKWAGGIGLHIHNIRATGSHINGTNGISNGILPMLKVFNNTARYVDQGGGKRNGSFAIYLEPWHADVEGFLNMRKNHGDEELKARDLFYALWIPDLFMERVKTDGGWTLMCPDECPHLADVYGEDFNLLYVQYEKEGRGRKTIKARELWFQILDAQMETGTPYLLFKDSANRKSNQKNLGTIKSSNLCVSPETKVLTERGYVKIETLEGQTTKVWNGYEYSEVVVYRTGENQELLEIETDDGNIVNCTKYHKFFIQKKTGVSLVEAQHLMVGDVIPPFVVPHDKTHRQTLTIARITDNGRKDTTFCFTEPLRNSAIFNGILTSQCSEIIQYSDATETAVCNLASIGLPSFVENGVFNYEKLHEVTRVITYNLNRVIDINYYPIEKTRISNMRHRPIGIGVQGLADVFMLMNIPYFSDNAKEINRHIFETIYHAAVEESCSLAIEEGPYETFRGSPASQGLLQFDLWDKKPSSGRYDWDKLKEEVKIHGMRNSLLVAPMPTASTSQILGFNECFEPITSNIYSRRTLAGEFIIANKYLMNDLIKLNLWNEKIKNNIIANNGSVQQIEILPQHIRDKYRTVWEIPMRHLIDMSAERGIYVCQSQSLNLWLEEPNYKTLNSMYFYAWSCGLKTGIYYLRRRARHQAQQFTIEPTKKDTQTEDDDEICEMCSS